MRENELEQRQMEAAKILVALKKQESELQDIINSQVSNSEQLENLHTLDVLDIQQIEAHKAYGLKLVVDAQNKERIISNTKMLFERKQIEVREAHKKVEVLKKLKEKQYVNIDDNGYITLTELGLKVAESVLERHEIISSVLIQLGVNDQTAYEDACRIEHDLSDETFQKIKEFYLNTIKK